MIVLALACNLPSQAATPTLDIPSILTETALALETLQTSTPFVTISPATQASTFTPTLSITNTPTAPIVSVSVNTNCRTGPGTVYDLIGALLVGERAVVVGKYPARNYWIINNPDRSGTCWLWGEYATVLGNTDGLPEYTPPPTPTPSITPTPTITRTPTISLTPSIMPSQTATPTTTP
jgi:hypothetical protein